jgi:hypothetical protein
MVFNFTTSNSVEYNIKNYIYDFETEIKNLNEAEIPKNDALKENKELEQTALNSANTPDT